VAVETVPAADAGPPLQVAFRKAVGVVVAEADLGLGRCSASFMGRTLTGDDLGDARRDGL